MKKVLLVALATVAVVGCNKADLKSDKGRASYAIGQQIGKNLKAQNIEIDPATIAASMKDAMAGKSEMKDDEIQKAMMTLQESAMKKQQEEAENNKKKSLKMEKRIEEELRKIEQEKYGISIHTLS